MGRRRGFSLTEVLIVMSILMVVSAVVVPKIADFADDGRSRALASAVRQVREQIEISSAVKTGGYPSHIDPKWFAGRLLPDHAWSGRPFRIETVSAPGIRAPGGLTWDGSALSPTAWYNASNGAFCALVPIQNTPEATADLFSYVNGVDAMVASAGYAGSAGGGEVEGVGSAGGGGGGGDDDDDDDDDD